MDNSKTGELIYKLRRDKGLTQKELANRIGVSDKAVSKWERGLGCPDISLLTEISKIMGISVDILLSGNLIQNELIGGNMKKVKYYICPECGNLSICTGNAEVTCCSRKLKPCEAKKADSVHELVVTEVEDDWYIKSNHPMRKDHYISFVAFATSDRLQIIKQYPEWNLETRIPKRCHGTLLWYCTKDGLFYKYI